MKALTSSLLPALAASSLPPSLLAEVKDADAFVTEEPASSVSLGDSSPYAASPILIGVTSQIVPWVVNGHDAPCNIFRARGSGASSLAHKKESLNTRFLIWHVCKLAD